MEPSLEDVDDYFKTYEQQEIILGEIKQGRKKTVAENKNVPKNENIEN